MKKRFLIICFLICFTFLIGCSHMNEEKKEGNVMNGDNEIIIDTLIGRWEEVPHKGSDWTRYIVNIFSDKIVVYWYSATGDEYEKKWEGSYCEPNEPVSDYSFTSRYYNAEQDITWEREFLYSNGLLSFIPIDGEVKVFVDPDNGEVLPIKLERVSN